MDILYVIDKRQDNETWLENVQIDKGMVTPLFRFLRRVCGRKATRVDDTTFVIKGNHSETLEVEFPKWKHLNQRLMFRTTAPYDYHPDLSVITTSRSKKSKKMRLIRK